MTLHKLLAEPLFLFAVIAAGMFGWHGLVAKRPPDGAAEAQVAAAPETVANRRIVVTDRLVDGLRDEFAWLEGRPPDAAETEALVDTWIQDEMLFREALALQMHRWDTKVRERLVARLRLMWAGVVDTPTDAELLDYYLEHIDRYYTERTLSFDQVFFEAAPADPQGVLARLAAGETVVGDDFWLGDSVRDFAESVLRASFGGAFYESLVAAAPDVWVGPLASPRGRHFVRLLNVAEPEPIPYAAIRDRIEQDWLATAQLARIEARLAQVGERYDIVRVAGGDE